jgi:hypothetical protein
LESGVAGRKRWLAASSGYTVSNFKRMIILPKISHFVNPKGAA